MFGAHFGHKKTSSATERRNISDVPWFVTTQVLNTVNPRISTAPFKWAPPPIDQNIKQSTPLSRIILALPSLATYRGTWTLHELYLRSIERWVS